MAKTGSPARPARAQTAAALSPEELYFEHHAEAVRRIYAPFYPDQCIRVVLKARDEPTGDPGAIQILEGDTGLSVVDDRYLGYKDCSPKRTKKRQEIAATIIAPIPRQIREGETFPEKTSPDFHGKPLLNRLLWTSPVLFEQLKYQYERRDEQL